MNWLDIIMLATLVAASFAGWRTGVVKTVLTAVGVVAGIFLAGRFGEPLGRSLEFITNENLAKVVGFVVVFAAVLIAAVFAANILRKILNLILLGWVDGVGGAALGVAVGGLVWTGLIASVGSFPIAGLDRAIEESTVAGFLSDNVSFVLTLLPEQYRDVLSLGEVAQMPTVTVTGVEVEEASASRVRMTAGLLLDNPNRFGASISKVEYRVYRSDGGDLSLLGSGVARDIRLGARAETAVTLPLALEGAEAATAAARVQDLLEGRSIQVRVEGTLSISFLSGALEVPFQAEATAAPPG